MIRIAFVASVLSGCLGSERMARWQYEADYRVAVQQCGQTEAAYQGGYNDGMAGKKMYGDWTSLCTPDVRAQTASAYRDGFLEGAQRAPVRIQVATPTVVRRTVVAAPVAQCTFDSDCGGGGLHCRQSVCMGNGYIGDQCTWNDDCLSDHCFGGTCRE